MIFFKIIIFLFLYSNLMLASDLNGPQAVLYNNNSENPVLVSASETVLLSATEIQKQIENSSKQGADILVTTDQEQVFLKTLESVENKKVSDAKIKILPLGRLVQFKDGISESWKQYKDSAVETLKNPIAMTIITITTLNDCITWFHTSSLSIHKQSTMALFSVMMVLAFSLDRERWNKMIEPLEKGIFKLLDRFTFLKSSEQTKIVISDYVANMSFTFGFLMARKVLISPQPFFRTVTNLGHLTSAGVIAAVSTYSYFSWSKLYYKVDKDKYPITKKTLAFFSDFRTIFMSYLATTAMVLQPQVYGYWPLSFLVIHGAVGMIANQGHDKIISWIENDRFFKKTAVYSDLNRPRQNILSCQMLF